MGNINDYPSTELPRWQCHKIVHAFKITKIVLDGEGENRESDGSARLYHDEGYFMPVKVDREYMNKHKPQVGGYYVAYEDGYKSWSPAKAFEDGYTRIK